MYILVTCAAEQLKNIELTEFSLFFLNFIEKKKYIGMRKLVTCL